MSQVALSVEDLRRPRRRHRGKRTRLQVVNPEEMQRPRTRGECANGPRPCPWVGCRHHLFLETRRSGSIKLNFPDIEPHQMSESCSLDLADRGGMTLDDVAEALGGYVREAVRQMIVLAIARMPPEGLRSLAEYLDGDVNRKRIRIRGKEV